MFRCIFIPVLFLIFGCVDQSRDVLEEGSPKAQIQTDSSTSSNSNSTGNTSSDESDQSSSPKLKVLLNVGENIVLPAYQALRDEAISFSVEGGALGMYCADLGTQAEPERLTKVFSGLRSLSERIQVVEVLQVGPLASETNGLHNRIHPYKDFSLATCSLDQAVVAHAEGDYDIEIRASNQKGFPAVEYLLANPSLAHSCPALVPVTQAWNSLAETDRKKQRCALAQTIANDIAEASTAAFDAWSSEEGGYLDAFTAEESVGENFQALSDALFYIEKITKSRKLTVPLGLDSDCSDATCASLVESPYLGNSLQNIAINLEAFLLVLEGGEGFGFDDIIDEAGFPDVSQRFRDQVREATENAQGNALSLAEQVELLEANSGGSACVNAFANPGSRDEDYPACTLAGLVKRITDDLKIDFVTIVEVSIPGNVQSDND